MMSFSKTSCRIVALAFGSRGFPQRSYSSKKGGDAPKGPAVKLVKNTPVAEIVLNRTKQLNAVTNDLIEGIRDALTWVNEEREVRCVIFRGDGKMFCSGLDLIEAQNIFAKTIPMMEKAKLATTVLGSKLMGTSPQPKPTEPGPPAMRNMELFRMMQRWHKAINMFRLCRVPVICCIHGKCIGAGTDLASPCDIRLCTADAEFNLRHTKMAIVPDCGTLQYAKHLVRSSYIREIAFTGRDFSAQEMHRYGFVNHVYANSDEMLAAAQKLAAEIAANSPLAVQGAKYVLNFAEEHSIEDSLEQMAFWNASFMKSEDLFAAVASFVSKSKPTFKNAMDPPPQ